MEQHYRYVTFFKITKKNNISDVKACIREAQKVSEKDSNFNPVQNSYTALWREYEIIEEPVPFMNVARRILEYYFLQLSGYDSEDLCRIVLEENKDKFKINTTGSAIDHTQYHLAKAMLSYIKRSTSFNDGLQFTDDSIPIKQYREVFHRIFKTMGQEQHYKFMLNKKQTNQQ